MSFVIGVDIGGSHITAAWVDLEDKIIVAGTRRRKFINSKGTVEEIIRDWGIVINEVLGDRPKSFTKIGIAMPGPFDYEEGISLINDQDKFRSLYKLNIKNILAKYLALEEGCIRFMNDAACFLQGEVFCGAAKNFNHVLGVTLGTGLGSAVCEGGLAEDADLWRYTFKDGIAEDYLSTRWFVKRYQELSGKSVSGVKELIEEKSLLEVKQVFLEFSENLGQFLIPQIKRYQSEAVVFGGNISNAFTFFQPELQQVLTAQQANVVLKKALLNEDASLIGAASCWKIVKPEPRTTYEPL